jgi:S-disulfanyl-L-cysteine oxidoreductase SoxD
MSSSAERRALSAPTLLLSACLGAAGANAADSGYFGYGTKATAEQIAGWDIDARADGAGLPDGNGTVAQGEEIYAQQCAACHGTFGEGEGRYPKLIGGEGTLTGDRPEPTVGSYWPFAPTLWDYINRAMPFQAPRSLSAADVYALTAYVLNLNNIVSNDFVADRNSLPKVKMPYRDRFIWQDPRPDTAVEACMTACVNPEDVKITSSAEGKDLTPRTTGPLDEMQPK